MIISTSRTFLRKKTKWNNLCEVLEFVYPCQKLSITFTSHFVTVAIEGRSCSDIIAAYDVFEENIMIARGSAHAWQISQSITGGVVPS